MFLTILGLKFVPFGVTTYKSEQTDINLKIPKLSLFKSECCMHSASFTSFSSVLTLKMELNSIMSKYEEYTCNNKNYYYDEKQNITINGYGVESNFLFNTFYINYNIGKYGNDYCGIVTDYTKLKYEIIDISETGYCFIEEEMKYLNSDGNLYNLHYKCFGNLAFQTGIYKMEYLNNMLEYEWISMDIIIKFLEYQVENSKADKNTYSDAILYKNNDFSLLQCNTTNKDIYIGSTSFKYKEDYCK